jgi:hypothetical protein
LPGVARRERIHDTPSVAYADYLYYVFQLQRLVRETAPRPRAAVDSPPAELLERLDQLNLITDLEHAAARASIIASEGVAAAIGDVDARPEDFVRRLAGVEWTPDAERAPDALKAELWP